MGDKHCLKVYEFENMTSDLKKFINSSSQLEMRIEFKKYLTELVDKYNIECIISIPRKGYWIIEDACKTYLRNKNLEHHFDDISEKINVSKKNVMIFDDSINTGGATEKSIDCVLVAKPASIIVACMAIKKETLQRIRDKYDSRELNSICYMKVFENYRVQNKENGKLEPGCQNYYYAFCIMPFIDTLCVKYSPYFCNWSIILNGSAPLNKIEAILSELFNIEKKKIAHPVSFSGIDKCVLMIPWMISIPYNIPYIEDFSKLRVSTIHYDESTEVVLTPMICPIICDKDKNKLPKGIDIENLPMILGKQFINTNKKQVMDAFNKDFKIISEKCVSLNKDKSLSEQSD